MVQPILTANCAGNGGGCHPNSGQLNLDAGSAYAALVNVNAPECGMNPGRKYVAPGQPSASYIMNKVLGTNLCSGVRMPASGPPYLSAAEIQIISDWICEGAPNN
jgi:hypothetical protein